MFIESFAGTDLMELADWMTFIDRMAQLKLNTIGVSIYGCWDIRHDGSRSEYLYTPLSRFPELCSPQRMITWDTVNRSQVELIYLPKMFEKNYFGELVDYAEERGIEILPHLGGPGHSTLVPRLVPLLSALDEDGHETGYGYCVTRETARNALRELIRSLVHEHLKPNRIRRLHVAGDEYYPIRNVDPTDRRRIVSPYCQCPTCRDLSPGEMLTEYLLQVGETLAEEEISMVNWHDTLVRERALDKYLRRAKSRGIPRPVIAWWKYNDPIPVPDSSLTETWSCPTTGLFPSLFYQDFSLNIETALRSGSKSGVAGAFAYGMPDPAHHANYACFADLAWNLEESGGADGFRERWSRYITKTDPTATRHALSLAQSITGCYPLMMYLLHHLLPYFATSSAGVTTYPDDLAKAFSVTQPPLADLLRQVVDTANEAIALMPDGREIPGWPDPVSTWAAELRRLSSGANLFLDFLAVTREPGKQTRGEAQRLTDRGQTLLQSVADHKPDFLRPSVLREHWGFVRELGDASERLRSGSVVAEPETWHAWIV
ncbi:family 20 glycosylhydrolase [Prauserella flavalba]|uniref:family 20 glycosylhydrolase n=1 Tax=Prauserella flavalba TaxID=1477506 RepID=UPI0036EBCDB1